MYNVHNEFFSLDAEDVVTFHSLLEMSAVEVLDRLVFQQHVDPALLEKKAQQLGFNVSASLVWGCCPPVPQGPALPPCLPPLTPDCVILNIPEPVSMLLPRYFILPPELSFERHCGS